MNTNTLSSGSTFKDVIDFILTYINYAIYIIIGLAILYFVWNVFKYYFKESGEESRKEGREFVLWAVIGMFVILSFWGLVNILMNTFGFDDNSPKNNIPSVISGRNDNNSRPPGGTSF